MATTISQRSGLERPQEIDDFLLFPSAQFVEMLNDLICLTATAPVSSNGVNQVGGPSVMEEEDTLSDTPEGSCPEFVGTGAALGDAVSESFAHVVDEKVGVEIRSLIGKGSTRAGRGTARNHFARGKRRCMALGTAYFFLQTCCVRSRWTVWTEQVWGGASIRIKLA